MCHMPYPWFITSTDKECKKDLEELRKLQEKHKLRKKDSNICCCKEPIKKHIIQSINLEYDYCIKCQKEIK